MNQTKFTPGPWKLMNSHKSGFVNVCATHDCNSAVDTIATDWICELGPGARDGQSEASCNARLISKAPEMFEALDWFSEYAAQHPDWTESFLGHADSQEREWFDAVRALINSIQDGGEM